MEDDLIAKAKELACLHLSQNNFEEAELICDQILKVEPNIIAELLRNECYKQLNKEIKFIEDPKDSDLLNEIGVFFLKSNLNEEATEYFFKSLILNIQNYHAWSNLAICYKKKKMYWTASKLLLKSLSIKEDKQSLDNLAKVYGEIRLIKKAEVCLRKALEIDPNYHAAKVDLATALFLLGNWEEPGLLYKSRFEHFSSLKNLLELFPKEKMWNGDNISGKNIILFSEQGIGDTFNFLRFVKSFEQKFPNNNISLFVPDQIIDFVKNQGLKIAVDPKKYDVCCSLMDLPWLLGLKKNEVLLQENLISSRKCDFSCFKNIFKIGICWAGNPANPRDKHRSCHLKLFKEIHDIPNVKLFSLQADTRPRMWLDSRRPVDLSADCSEMRIVNMQPYMKTWDDTASIISELDLVISVDTSILHLSASLGKTTFGLISYLPDWRWGLDSEDNIWYPNLKLFRQENIDDWENPINRIKNLIEQQLF